MKLTVQWVSEPQNGETSFSLADLNCETEEQWNGLSEEDKNERIQVCLNLLEQPTIKQAP